MAPIRIYRASGVIIWRPGRKIMRIPIKPNKIANHRLKRTISCKKNTAPKVANRGAVKPREVASASGRTPKPANQKNIEMSPPIARNKCMLSFFVFKPPIPILISQGSMIIRLTKLRKKTTSTVGISREAMRIETPRPAKKIPEASIQIAPRVVGASFSHFSLLCFFETLTLCKPENY